MELNVLKIQRSQEPCVNDDSESEKSDEEKDEEIYVDVPPVVVEDEDNEYDPFFIRKSCRMAAWLIYLQIEEVRRLGNNLLTIEVSFRSPWRS